MSTASHIKQMSRNSLSVMDFTHCISKEILHSKYNDVRHISEILNSLVGQVKILPFVNSTDWKDEERHFSVELKLYLIFSYFCVFPTSSNIHNFVHGSSYDNHDVWFCVSIVFICIHIEKIDEFHTKRSIFTVCRAVLAFKISSVRTSDPINFV
jgi:hypothetical protein